MNALPDFGDAHYPLVDVTFDVFDFLGALLLGFELKSLPDPESGRFGPDSVVGSGLVKSDSSGTNWKPRIPNCPASS
jgi:hypothetical protein